MDNKISRGLTKAKQKSKVYHLKKNEALYKEYLQSSAQFKMSFVEWKKKLS